MMSIRKGDRLWRFPCFASIEQKLRRDAQLMEKKFIALQHCVREESASVLFILEYSVKMELFNIQENNSVHSFLKSLYL